MSVTRYGFWFRRDMQASPVVYPLSVVPERWHPVYSIHPLVAVIEGFLVGVFLARRRLHLAVMATGGSVVLLLLAGGLVYFKRMERTFADVI